MGNLKLPRLLIAGTHSGVGKTTVTVGLIQALRRKGWVVQPFKAGPDYVDPGYLTAAAGRACRNLDAWLVPPDRLPAVFQSGCRDAGIGIVEGVMGLYDGASATGDEGSTAELAKLLRCPVILVVDAGAISRSAAAVMRGFLEMDRKVQIRGCIVNRLSGPGHYRLVREAIERLTGIPVVGWLPREERLQLPERHLGLVPRQESGAWEKVLGPLNRHVQKEWDLAAIRRIAQRAEPLSFDELRMSGKVPIAVAQDEAFHFYYPENLELLQGLGAEVVPFSPLRDAALPKRAGALYLGGGFPEIFARELAKNRPMRQAIRRAVAAGMPTYAECGGLMVLTQSIQDGKGRRHAMVGVIPGTVRMTDRLQNFGYKRLRARKNSLLARKGEQARGHEFHHSVWSGGSASSASAYEAASVSGRSKRLEGYARQNLLASYVHLHFSSQPRWAQRFVEAARHFQERTGS